MSSSRLWSGCLLVVGLVFLTGCMSDNPGGSDIQIVLDDADASDRADGADATGTDTRTLPDSSPDTDRDSSPPPDASADTDATADGTDGETADTTDAGGPTWNSFADEFFETYCVECHGADDNDQDYRQYADVEQDAAAIRCGVTPEPLDDCSGSPRPNQFPVGNGPEPSDAERQKLVDWIDAGLPKE